MSVDILQREINQVALRIDTYRMRMRHGEVADFYKTLSIFPIYPHFTGFGRNIELLQSWIESQDIWVIPNRVGP